MQNKLNPFLLLIDSRSPDTQYICQCQGRMRVQVSIADKVDLLKIRSGSVYGISEGNLYLFENLTSFILDTSILLIAIKWYKRITQISDLKILGWNLRSVEQG
ncbi:MAG TPA: hypothetical protein VF602_07865 [Pedobacter sp.]|jgi:hypothetical protein